MTAVRPVSVFGLAVLLAAATAVADTVITTDDVTLCSFESVGAEREVRLPESQLVPGSGRQDGLPSTREDSLQRCDKVVDTLPRRTSPGAMAAKCREVKAALLERGRSDDTVAALLRDVHREEEALGRLWPGAQACAVSGLSLGFVGGGGGFLIGYGSTLRDPQANSVDYMNGCCAGSIYGSLTGTVIGWALHEGIAAGHRKRVNNLVRRVNRTVVAAP